MTLLILATTPYMRSIRQDQRTIPDLIQERLSILYEIDDMRVMAEFQIVLFN
jgi:hypothetical protein